MPTTPSYSLYPAPTNPPIAKPLPPLPTGPRVSRRVSSSKNSSDASSVATSAFEASRYSQSSRGTGGDVDQESEVSSHPRATMLMQPAQVAAALEEAREGGCRPCRRRRPAGRGATSDVRIVPWKRFAPKREGQGQGSGRVLHRHLLHLHDLGEQAREQRRNLLERGLRRGPQDGQVLVLHPGQLPRARLLHPQPRHPLRGLHPGRHRHRLRHHHRDLELGQEQAHTIHQRGQPVDRQAIRHLRVDVAPAGRLQRREQQEDHRPVLRREGEEEAVPQAVHHRLAQRRSALPTPVSGARLLRHGPSAHRRRRPRPPRIGHPPPERRRSWWRGT